MGHERQVPRKQSPGHNTQSLPLITTLPPEILDAILGIVLKNGMLASIKQQTPIFGLRQYRALIMTCKLFKTIVDNACLQITMQCINLPVHPRIFTLKHVLGSLYPHGTISLLQTLDNAVTDLTVVQLHLTDGI